MPLTERERMLNALDPELKALQPQRPSEPEITEQQWDAQGPIEFDTVEAFCNEVRQETELSGDGEDAEAIQAVFGALKYELSQDEVTHIHERLPKGLKQMWASA